MESVEFNPGIFCSELPDYFPAGPILARVGDLLLHCNVLILSFALILRCIPVILLFLIAPYNSDYQHGNNYHTISR